MAAHQLVGRRQGAHRLPARGGRVHALALGVIVALGAGPAFASGPAPVRNPAPVRPAPAAIPVPTPAPPAATCSRVGGWDCDWSTRLQRAGGIVQAAPGEIAFIVRDRETGAEWTAGNSGARVWTGSTIKLALAVTALETARAEGRPLDEAERSDLEVMLHVSDDAAAGRVWQRHGGRALLPVFRGRFGMTGLEVTGSNGDWGALTCRAADLANLMQYALTTLHPADRAFLVERMRAVGSIQQWGVWSAGGKARPGVKDGWLENRYDGRSHWATSTVGFAGPAERFIVVGMYQMPDGADSLDLGARTLSDVVAAVFGQPLPAPVTPRPT